jgi:FkbM family methyltransferase
MWGYGLAMAYPDREVWLHQAIEIFGRDCYGVRKLPAAPRIVDGGANVGMFSLCALWRRPMSRIVCVEPAPQNLDYLRRNLADNRAGDRVRIIEAALGRGPGTSALSGERSDSLRCGQGGGTVVRVIGLSDALDEPTHLLKLDIEGGETGALSAALPALRRVGRVAMEYHVWRGTANGLPDLLALLREGGFDRFAVFGCRDFPAHETWAPAHCCMVEAWRAADPPAPGR